MSENILSFEAGKNKRVRIIPASHVVKPSKAGISLELDGGDYTIEFQFTDSQASALIKAIRAAKYQKIESVIDQDYTIKI